MNACGAAHQGAHPGSPPGVIGWANGVAPCGEWMPVRWGTETGRGSDMPVMTYDERLQSMKQARDAAGGTRGAVPCERQRPR